MKTWRSRFEKFQCAGCGLVFKKSDDAEKAAFQGCRRCGSENVVLAGDAVTMPDQLDVARDFTFGTDEGEQVKP